MAKIKVKKESVLKLRFTEHSGQEWELWRKFYSDLIKSLAPKGFYIDLGHQNQGLIWLSRGTAKEEINEADITEIAQKHNIEIEFEEEEKKKEEKWRPVHEILIELIENYPETHLETVAVACAEKAKIPKKGIPKLLQAFVRAALYTPPDLYPRATIEQAVKNLKEQQQKEEE